MEFIDKHPPSLRIFFTTEMWERYGFYVVQSLLALYLTSHFNWSDKKTYALVGSFTALTYLSPLVGGWIADQLIGQKKAILAGAATLFSSYCFLSFFDGAFALNGSLAAIAVGTGLLKPNISSLLGNEYLQGCARRESGFTIFYMGITSGIILGTTVPSILALHFGWSASFLSAAIGMIIAFCVFSYGVKRFKIKDYNHPFVLQPLKALYAIALILVLWALSFYILSFPQLANIVFALVVVFSAAYVIYAARKEHANQSRKTLIIGLLCIISIVFWSFYFQMFMSLTLFITRVVEPKFMGLFFPAPYYVTVQSIGMLVIGYFLSKSSSQHSLVQRGKSIASKFMISILILTIAYLSISMVINYSEHSLLIAPILILPAYIMFSFAELLLSPVGLAAVTLLSDKNKVSTLMGIFFVSLGIGGFLSGKLAALSAIPDSETNVYILKQLYASAFKQQAWILMASALVCLILYFIIRKLLAGVKESAAKC